nr:hypothetical protein [Tanacetum cinerariifolium]
LFLFAHGGVDSARVIMDSLDEFQSVSGLVPSLPKSTTYFCNVLRHTKIVILHIIPFEEGRLPVKYLRVPLISTRLVYRDCKELIEKVQNRIQDWKNKLLSATGRLQLLCSGDMRKGKAKVTWDVVCIPKKEGGLGAPTPPHVMAICMDNIRPRGDEVGWYGVVWFSQCIPRHAFHLWLVIKRKLKTQDNLRQWDVSNHANLNLLQCPLCGSQPNSHEHLFFECAFSLQVWNYIKVFAGLPIVSSSLNAIVDVVIARPKRRSVRGIIARLVITASRYFTWQERNYRLFKNQRRTHNQLIECIKSTVRLNLLTCSFKKTRNVMAFVHLWKLPNSLIILDS